MKLPQAKLENIVVQNLNDETLIYDMTTDRAYCLNETAAKVFDRCDGKTTFDELKVEYRLTDEIIYLALDGLKKENLIVGEYISPFAGMNRREVIKKVGLASVIALPVISSLLAPHPAQAASNQVNIAACQPCTVPEQCASGICAAVIDDSPNRICTNTEYYFAYKDYIDVAGQPDERQYCIDRGIACCSGKGATFTLFRLCSCNS